MKQVIQFIRNFWRLKGDLWRASTAPGLHWHFFGFHQYWVYKIAWEELHKAHLIYIKRINATVRAHQSKRDSHGRFKKRKNK